MDYQAPEIEKRERLVALMMPVQPLSPCEGGGGGGGDELDRICVTL